jgi:hypothetical protein
VSYTGLYVPQWIGTAGTFLTEPPLEFRREAAELAPETRVEVLAIGQTLELPLAGATS